MIIKSSCTPALDKACLSSSLLFIADQSAPAALCRCSYSSYRHVLPLPAVSTTCPRHQASPPHDGLPSTTEPPLPIKSGSATAAVSGMSGLLTFVRGARGKQQPRHARSVIRLTSHAFRTQLLSCALFWSVPCAFSTLHHAWPVRRRAADGPGPRLPASSMMLDRLQAHKLAFIFRMLVQAPCAHTLGTAHMC